MITHQLSPSKIWKMTLDSSAKDNGFGINK